MNVLRLNLHPEGLAPRIANLGQWRGHVLARLQRQIEVSSDPVLVDLRDELRAYPAADGGGITDAARGVPLVIPLRLQTPAGPLSFISTTTVFSTAVDITLSELAIESFFPADAATAEALRSDQQSAVSLRAQRRDDRPVPID